MLHLQVLDISIVPKYWCSCIYTHNYVIFWPTRKFFTNMETALGANVLFAIEHSPKYQPFRKPSLRFVYSYLSLSICRFLGILLLQFWFLIHQLGQSKFRTVKQQGKRQIFGTTVEQWGFFNGMPHLLYDTEPRFSWPRPKDLRDVLQSKTNTALLCVLMSVMPYY